jgi:hypothetical protein
VIKYIKKIYFYTTHAWIALQKRKSCTGQSIFRHHVEGIKKSEGISSKKKRVEKKNRSAPIFFNENNKRDQKTILMR